MSGKDRDGQHGGGLPARAPVGVGRAADLRLPRRRHQRAARRAEPRRRAVRVRAGPPRGDGGVHGLRAREVHRRGRRVPGDLRARARCICSTGSTTPSSTTSRWSRSSASRRAPGWAATTSRRSTSTSLFKDVCHEYVHVAMDPAQIRHLVDRAMRIAAAERTPTCVIVPNDLQEADAVEDPPRAHGTLHSGIGDGYRAAARRARGRRPAARGRDPQRRRARGDAGRARAPCTPAAR